MPDQARWRIDIVETRRAAGRQLLTDIARCPLVEIARTDPQHPCRRVVTHQPRQDAEFQVPEGWAGNLTGARVLFLSSNPGLSEPAADGPDTVEDYPRAGWWDDRIVEFLDRRFDPHQPTPPVLDGRFRRRDGNYSAKPVSFWSGIRNRAQELLPPGEAADPNVNYAMTEIVHCKSRREALAGVRTAAGTCADRWLDRVLALSPAPVLVLVGAIAREVALPAFGLQTLGSTIAVEAGGRSRLLTWLDHPASSGQRKTFAKVPAGELVRLREAIAVERVSEP